MKADIFEVRMKKFLLLLSLILVAGFVFGSLASPQEEEKFLIASGHQSWGPVMYHNGFGYIEGQAPDVLAAALEGTRFHVVSKYVGTWDIVQQKARTSEVDIIVALYKTEEREEYLLYSLPYLKDPIAIFTKDQSLTSLTIEEIIAQKKGIVTKGDSYGVKIDGLLEETEVLMSQDPQEAKERLLSGEGDYFLFSLYGGEELFKEELSEKELFSSIVGSECFYFGVSKKTPGAERIVQILNDYIRENDLLVSE